MRIAASTPILTFVLAILADASTAQESPRRPWRPNTPRLEDYCGECAERAKVYNTRSGIADFSYGTLHAAQLQEVRANPDVNRIHISYCRIEEPVFDLLSGFDQLTMLFLTVSEGVDAQAMRKISRMRNLSLLQFTYVEVSEGALAAVSEMSGLRQLRFHGAPITDAGLENVANLTELEFLRLQDVNVRGWGLQYLEGLEKLERLTIDAEVDSRDIAELRNKLPNLTVTLVGGPKNIIETLL